MKDQRFGAWRTIGDSVFRGRHRYTMCICACGKQKMVCVDNLKSGKTKSCGCLGTKMRMCAGCGRIQRTQRLESRRYCSRRCKTDHEVVDRFWVSFTVDEKTDCWLWTGSIQQNGYGQASRDNKHLGAHRYAYELLVGEIPDGFEIDHICRVRHCVNPKHLEVVTVQENSHRGRARRNGDLNRKKTHCHRGHPFDSANTKWVPTNYGEYTGRQCRACNALRARGYSAAKRQHQSS